MKFLKVKFLKGEVSKGGQISQRGASFLGILPPGRAIILGILPPGGKIVGGGLKFLGHLYLQPIIKVPKTTCMVMYSHCSFPCTIPLTEGILRLGINNFQSKVECGEASCGSVAAEGRWVDPKTVQCRPSF